ncbi:YitT family protein [Prevotella denticola]|uniref:YitT family protein n=1 Tax=Prevotella denticola TaxID=28129 RepID=UPI001BABB94C|nr:YitT family protein [Prevotella denticola]MBW4760546.1 YitT family protein [Prevotella denticola]QUB92320.1 YitT family protein [Prevotella denticola]
MVRKRKSKFRDVFEFLMIALAMVIGSFGWCAFLLPHHITIGGIAGIASVIQWGFDIPVQYTYLIINGILLFVALKILGWKFCVRTIFAVLVFASSTSILREVFAEHALFANEPFLACVVGGVLLGIGVSIALQYNASSGGSDVIAAMIHKYRDISLGRVILVCDLCIITSSYLVLENWEKVIYGYIVLFVMTYMVDYLISGMRGSVQFFVISEHWGEIGTAINNDVDRGCTLIEARGFYTGKKVGMLFIIARRSEAHSIYQVIDEIDPNAFVSQGVVNGVYGMGFDRMKVPHKKRTVEEAVKEKA